MTRHEEDNSQEIKTNKNYKQEKGKKIIEGNQRSDDFELFDQLSYVNCSLRPLTLRRISIQNNDVVFSLFSPTKK